MNNLDIISTRTVEITPAMADSFLVGNSNNRSIRNRWVNELVELINTNQFKLTHQGICISRSGRVLDGQHRLTAISRSGKSVRMQVSTVGDEESFNAIDMGVKRTVSESTGIDTRKTAIYTFIIREILKDRSTAPWKIKKMDEGLIGVQSNALIEACGTSKRFYSSSPVKAAFVTALLKLYPVNKPAHDKYLYETYKNLILLNFEELSRTHNSFIRAVSNGTFNTINKLDCFCYAFKAIDSEKSEIKTLRLGANERADIIAEARAILTYPVPF